MRALVAIGILALFLAAPASAAPAGFDLDPILVVRFETNTIAGQRIETQLVLHAGGATEIVDVTRDTVTTSRGVASRESFIEIQQALSAGRVAFERGGCGGPLPDGPIEYHVTWYGRGGSRFNSFRVGANPEGCLPGTARLVRAISALLLDIYTSPDTQVFPSAPGGS
jgi:hypothetical protein